MRKILFFLNPRREKKPEGFVVKKQKAGLSYTVMSYTIQEISPNEVDAIISIIDEELRNDYRRMGQNIAERIVNESGIHQIASAQVSGQRYGAEWIVNISSNPFEFID